MDHDGDDGSGEHPGGRALGRVVDDPDESTDEQQLDAYAAALVRAIDAAVVGWVQRCVDVTCARAGVAVDADLAVDAAQAAAAARAEVTARLTALFAADLDDQGATPLQVLRDAVRFPTVVLAGASVPPVDRDGFDRRSFPDDVYGLTPAGFGDVDPSLVGPAIAWGAAKAHVHLRRRDRGSAPD